MIRMIKMKMTMIRMIMIKMIMMVVTMMMVMNTRAAEGLRWAEPQYKD